MGIGTRIRELRKRAGMTQLELSERVGVHETSIRRWEKEKIPNALVYERNGERMELPPTEESYAIFKEIARMIAGREIGHSSAVAMA